MTRYWFQEETKICLKNKPFIYMEYFNCNIWSPCKHCHMASCQGMPLDIRSGKVKYLEGLGVLYLEREENV
jgi:hypothetical protein